MKSSDQRVKNHFGSIAHFYGKKYFDTTTLRGHLYSTRLERVFQLLGEIGRLHVLDVGCGPGMAADYFLRKECGFFGVDLSEEMLREFQNRVGEDESVLLAAGDIKSLPFPNASFDLVLCLGVIEYVNDANYALREISRIVKNNGCVIISMQNKLSPYRLWDYKIYRSNFFNAIRKAIKGTTSEEAMEKMYALHDFRDLMINNQLILNDVVYYDFNIMLRPLDRYFPNVSVAISKKLEFLYRSRLGVLGTGYIIKAEKIDYKYAH